MASSQDSYRSEVVTAGMLWLVGFKEACQLHRAILFCKQSRPVLVRTGQCFLLNGCLFLGSIFILRHVFTPMLLYFLGHTLQSPAAAVGHVGHVERRAGMLQNVIVGACYVLWLYPLYVFSFIVNIVWYNDIAKHAFQAMGKSSVESGTISPDLQRPGGRKETGPTKGHPSNQSSGGLQGTVLQVGEKIYSVIMVSVFFVQVLAVTYVPYLGTLLNFILLSWLYAYYCFDYKWGFSQWTLERRILFFETNWAFFAGFGSPCVLATFFLSPFISAGVMNVLFPLFVLVATASNPEEAVQNSIGRHNSTGTIRRLPIFYLANNLTVPLLRLFQAGVSRTPSSIQSRKKGFTSDTKIL